MKEKSIFFERISQIIDYYGIKSVNSFALDYLKYDSSEKINRLKRSNTNPSYEILCDIANKFEEIDMNWLLLGLGHMLKKENSYSKSEIKAGNQTSFNCLLENQTVFTCLLNKYEKLAFENGKLTAELNAIKNQAGGEVTKKRNSRDDRNRI